MSQKEKNELDNLRKYLDRGDVSLVASSMGVTRQTIHNVLVGDNQNAKLLEAIRVVALKRKEQHLQKLEALKKEL